MAIVYALIAITIWGVNAVVNKLSVGVIEPGVIAFYRWFFALLILTPWTLKSLRQDWQKIKPHLIQLVILGLLGMGLYQSLAYYAAYSISALMIGIFSSLIPLLTILFNCIILKIPPTRGILVGSGISFFGILWLITQGQPQTIFHITMKQGEWMMLGAALSYALYGVLINYWAMPIAHQQAAYMQIVFGTLLLIPNFILSEHWTLTRHNIGLVAYAAIPASIIAPIVWIKSIIKLGASKSALFMNLSPIITAIISIGYLNESLNHYHLIGGSLTLLGVILAQLWHQPLFMAKKIMKIN